MSGDKQSRETEKASSCPPGNTKNETTNTNRLKVLIALGAIFFIGSLVVSWAADPPGYCKGYRRYISDEEFIRAVILLVRERIARDKGASKGDAGGGSFFAYWNHYIPEPGDTNCCEVNRQETHSLVNRLFGWQSIVVYIAPPDKKKGGPSSTSGLNFYFDICGVLVDSDIGARSRQPPQGVRITTTPIDGD